MKSQIKLLIDKRLNFKFNFSKKTPSIDQCCFVGKINTNLLEFNGLTFLNVFKKKYSSTKKRSRSDAKGWRNHGCSQS